MRYDALKIPDPEAWLELDESERLYLVKRYHIRAKLPVAENERLHAAFMSSSKPKSPWVM